MIDSSAVLQYSKLMKDPSKHEFYGLSMKWKTSVDDVPQGLDSKQLDDWLWRRRKPNIYGQMMDLRNRGTFPDFAELPHDRDFDPEFSPLATS
jgi:hypothetical protein